MRRSGRRFRTRYSGTDPLAARGCAPFQCSQWTPWCGRASDETRRARIRPATSPSGPVLAHRGRGARARGERAIGNAQGSARPPKLRGVASPHSRVTGSMQRGSSFDGVLTRVLTGCTRIGSGG